MAKPDFYRFVCKKIPNWFGWYPVFCNLVNVFTDKYFKSFLYVALDNALNLNANNITWRKFTRQIWFFQKICLLMYGQTLIVSPISSHNNEFVTKLTSLMKIPNFNPDKYLLIDQYHSGTLITKFYAWKVLKLPRKSCLAFAPSPLYDYAPIPFVWHPKLALTSALFMLFKFLANPHKHAWVTALWVK